MKSLAVALAILMLVFASGCEKQKETPRIGAGDPAPDFVLNDVNGNTVRLSDFKGKVVVLEFWATWCPPCIAAIPELNELQAKYIDQDFVLIGVSVDESMELVKAFYGKHEMTYLVVLDDKSVSTDFGIYSIPTSVIIGKDGKIITRHLGYGPGVLQELVEKALSGKSTE